MWLHVVFFMFYDVILKPHALHLHPQAVILHPQVVILSLSKGAR